MTVEDKNSPPDTSRPSTACPSNRKPDEDAVAVRVAVHIRPLVEQELAKGCQEILDVVPATAQVTAAAAAQLEGQPMSTDSSLVLTRLRELIAFLVGSRTDPGWAAHVHL
eukprot:GHUV01047882.1.p1 GENE.GHUV01047882.1~~GHUV01047882.1.p1  ORF type:complete len:110 (-),score=25.64 GHUV01047882.1:133-462(-)